MSQSPGKVIEEQVWNTLAETVKAANRCDADAYAQWITRWSRELPLQARHQCGLYLWYMMQYRIKDLLRREPTPADLHQLANNAYPQFREVLSKAEEIHLEEALRRALEFKPLEIRLTAGEFQLFGAAALGVLLSDPEHDMEAMRPSLEVWWSRNRERFASLGVSGAERP